MCMYIFCRYVFINSAIAGEISTELGTLITYNLRKNTVSNPQVMTKSKNICGPAKDPKVMNNKTKVEEMEITEFNESLRKHQLADVQMRMSLITHPRQ